MNRSMHVVFCDDVRQEVGNKISMMGIYGADLFVNEIPSALQRLWIVVRLVTEVANPFRSLSLSVFKGAERVAELPIPEEALVKALELLQREPPTVDGDDGPTGPRMFTHSAILSIAPYPIEKPHVLRVIAKADGEEIRGAGLRVALTPTPATPQSEAGGQTVVVPMH